MQIIQPAMFDHGTTSGKWEELNTRPCIVEVERLGSWGRPAIEQEKVASQASSAQQRGAMPKAKVMMTHQQAVPTTVLDLEEDPELFEILPEPESPGPVDPALMANPSYPLEDRMLQVENALNKVINYIEQNVAHQATEQ